MPTSVALNDHFEKFLHRQVGSGRYNNVSEVIRAGLRLLEDQEVRQAIAHEELRLAVAAGLTSGSDVSGEQVFDRLEVKYSVVAEPVD